MGLCGNAIVFVLICSLTLLLNPFYVCQASNQHLCIPSERKALLTFKQHLLDPLNRLASWSIGNPNCCNWTSVACNPVTGHILQLHLSTLIPPQYLFSEYDAYERSRFGGELHPSMLDLKELSFLDLSGNYFGGMQLPSFLHSMKSLTHLNLSYAGLSGSIPQQIGNLSSLLHLNLGGNDFNLLEKFLIKLGIYQIYFIFVSLVVMNMAWMGYHCMQKIFNGCHLFLHSNIFI
ncbi:hypothetical protein K1719_024641 [Acacia pycnantha]|nr:hypothetical protein K1719_024641 [Acacia pycnantha]